MAAAKKDTAAYQEGEMDFWGGESRRTPLDNQEEEMETHSLEGPALWSQKLLLFSL